MHFNDHDSHDYSLDTAGDNGTSACILDSRPGTITTAITPTRKQICYDATQFGNHQDVDTKTQDQ
jgi:hypothetical protein